MAESATSPSCSSILENAGADYRWRAIVAHAEWVTAVAILAAGIDYPNFKSAVGERQGDERKRLYSHVWGELLGLQERP